MKAASLLILALVGCALAHPTPNLFDGPAPFSDTDVATMMTFFMENINIGGMGGVVASPDTAVPGGGSYYYHWMRDGALSMRTVWRYNSTISNALALMKTYINFIVTNQNQADPNGIDIRGEPKFFLPGGQVDNLPWCRPQNDGPAVRSATLMLFAQDLMEIEGLDFVRQYLWTGSSAYNGGAIKYDLDYVVNSWSSNGCDLWEEIQSNDFFWNRFNSRKALLMGSQFAALMGDQASASRYYQAANQIGTLDYHYNGQFVYESTDRQEDAATIIAFNVGYNNDGCFSPLDGRVAATVTTLSELFNSTFPINGQDTANGIPGILYGRYAGDTYAGGNPWILISGALAELYYRGAAAAFASNELPSEQFLNNIQKQLDFHGLRHELTSNIALANALTDLGDGVLARIRYHTVGGGLHQAEQLDKYSGYEKSAYDLTWSYSSIFDALWTRNQISAEGMKKESM